MGKPPALRIGGQMATVVMFRDSESGELTTQASSQPDWMAESLWVAVGAIQRGQAVIVMDDEASTVAEEIALQEEAEGSAESKPLTVGQVKMMFEAMDKAAETRRR